MLRDPAVLFLLLASALWPHALRLVQTTRTPVVFVAASQPKRVAPATCPGQPQGNCYNPAGWLKRTRGVVHLRPARRVVVARPRQLAGAVLRAHELCATQGAPSRQVAPPRHS